MNEYDSQRIYDNVTNLGFIKTTDQANAECYVLNTCHIRDKAKEKVYHEIGRVKKLYRDKKINTYNLTRCWSISILHLGFKTNLCSRSFRRKSPE